MTLTKRNDDALFLPFSNHFSDINSALLVYEPRLAGEGICSAATMCKLLGLLDNFVEFVRIQVEFHCGTT